MRTRAFSKLPGLAFAILLLATSAALPTGLKLSQDAKGTRYVTDEIQFALKPEFAKQLSQTGKSRRVVDKNQLKRLHRLIKEVRPGHTAAECWLAGGELPPRILHPEPEVPRIARTLTAVLKEGVDAAAVVKEFAALPELEWASLSIVYDLDYVPNDPSWASQWSLSRILADQAWDIQPASTTVDVAVVDSGVDLDHNDLAGVISYQRGFAGNSSGNAPPQRAEDTADTASHGTHVAGIIAAVRDNNFGVAGIAQARIMAMGCSAWSDQDKRYKIANAEDAINDAIANGAEIINCSFGAPYFAVLSPAMSSALDNARAHNVLVVCSAGNSTNYVAAGTEWDAHPQPLVVAATDRADNSEEYSSFGPAIDLSAPGEDIFSPSIGGFSRFDGTSAAAPHVSGAAALLFSMNRTRLDDDAVKDLFKRMAVDLGPTGKDDFFGWGRLSLPRPFIRTIREADLFVGQPGSLLPGAGSYTVPYASLEAAVGAAGSGDTLVINGGTSDQTAYSYPPITITKSIVLRALPDKRVTIGQ